MLNEHFLKICLLLSLIIHGVLLKITHFHISSAQPPSSVELRLAYYFIPPANKLNKVKTDAKKLAKKQLKNFKPQETVKIARTISKRHLQIKKLSKPVSPPEPVSNPVITSKPPDIPKTAYNHSASISPLSQNSKSVPNRVASILSTHNPLSKKDVLEAYLYRLKQRIEQNKKYPFLARKMGFEGKVVVEFCIDQRGRLINIKIKDTSGYTVLDRAAMEAIKDATPFPPFPENLTKDKIIINLPIYFRLSS